MGDNQFKHWFIYFLIIFVVTTLITEVYYLNMALALFNTAMVTPTYYVIFTFCSMVTTVVLFQGLKASATQILTIVMAFFTICIGITILQMSKVDPVSLTKLDRRSTLLLQVARQNTGAAEEKSAAGFEDPGIDTLRGAFGSFIRANTARRMSRSSRGASSLRNRMSAGSRSHDIEAEPSTSLDKLGGMTRHQLYDAPVPRKPDSIDRASSFASTSTDRRPTIKFDSQDVVHQYRPTGKGDTATHEHRNAMHGYPYPPIPSAQGQASPGGADISDTNLVGGDGMRQTVTMSPPTDSVPRTAPPVLNASFFSPPPKDFFENIPATTLSSTFPSASDSSGSHTAAPWYSDDEETKKTRAHTHKYGRSYPRGEDDKDESVSLWSGSGSGDLEEEEASHSTGGIRLVKPSSDTRF
jgi:hypothetical protein